MNDLFQLQNTPNKPTPKPQAPPQHQRPLFTGLNCLPGQLDLVPDLDKPREPLDRLETDAKASGPA